LNNYHLLLHSTSFRKLQDYRTELAVRGLVGAGGRLRANLWGQDVTSLSDEAFLQHLLNTKSPCRDEQGEVHGDGRDWNSTELALLADLGLAVPVQFFDDGRLDLPQVHQQPLAGTLIFTAGVVLGSREGGAAADWAAVTHNGRIEVTAYQALYERRLVPLLLHINADARSHGQKALVTLPGLGGGPLAGPFQGKMGTRFKDTLLALLGKLAPHLSAIQAIYYDPSDEGGNERHDFGGVSLRVRPLNQGNGTKPQLCPPEIYAEKGEDLEACRLYSLAAWEPTCWPGDSFWGGARASDEGAKAAATDVLRALTGIEGQYDPQRHAYQPPPPYRTWEQLARNQPVSLRIGDNLQILG